jgi:hypothetical protein
MVELRCDSCSDENRKFIRDHDESAGISDSRAAR